MSLVDSILRSTPVSSDGVNQPPSIIEKPTEDLPIFKPGSIHDPAVRSFWVNVLKCSEWVTDVLRYGYKIPFSSMPGPYEEPNNKSVTSNMSVVLNIVHELRELKVIEFVSTKPHCVSPLGLVQKEVNAVLTYRLVFDASRWINLHVHPPVVKLSYLQKALQITHANDYQVVFDLKSAYYNVRITDEHVQYLGASVLIEGRKQYFVFRHLPFGLNSAVAAITKLWKPLIAYFHLNNIRASIYIDDGRILASSDAQAEQFRVFVYDVIKKAGWILASNKSDGPLEASKRKLYLGFEIQTDSMLVLCPSKKLLKVCELITTSLALEIMPVKHLAKLLGNVIALLPSHGSVVRICTGSGYAALENHVDNFGWTGMLKLTPAIKIELRFFLNNADRFNGFPIPNSLIEVRVDTYLVAPQTKKSTLLISAPIDTVIASDASASKAAVKWLQGNPKHISNVFQFSDSERRTSSGERELLAVHKLLQQCVVDRSLERTHVLWVTDSENLVVFLEKGSGKKSIQLLAFDILKWCVDLQCTIHPIHLYRTDERIRQVDYLSKNPDSDDWSVDQHTFAGFHEDFHFEVDLFASFNNKKVPLFASKYYHPESLGVDAFSLDWHFMAWVCPPVSLLLRVITRIRNSRCQGLLIVPNWPASDFYWELFEEGHARPPFRFVSEFRPYIFQNEGAKNTALFGITPFTFYALYFHNDNK